MHKTHHQIQSDLYQLVLSSSLRTLVDGGVYLTGMRPRGSVAEDIVVAYVGGVAGEVQQAVAYINIYVADIDPWGNGVLVEDAERVQHLEAAAADFAATLTCAVSDYRITLYEPIHTVEVEEMRQHCVVLPLRLDYLTNI